MTGRVHAMVAAVLLVAMASVAPPVAAQSARAPNRVLVLGSPHLSGWPKQVPLDNLAPLIDRLAAWRPQIISIEAIPGEDCWMMRQQPQFAEVAKSYCPSTEAARAATGLDVLQAATERDRLLAALPAAPSAGQRRRLAAVMLAAGDQASALVQWLRLPASERHQGEGIDAALAGELTALESRRNEKFAVAARLAARLGLERVIPMDHQAVEFQIDDEEAYGRAVQAAWDASGVVRTADETAAEGEWLHSPEGVLRAYRMYNAPGHPARVYARDFGAALADPSAGQYGRMYVTYWETRNLRMAANIREALGPVPGSRMLVIVGASHKGYLDAYLKAMRDVELADAEAILQ